VYRVHIHHYRNGFSEYVVNYFIIGILLFNSLSGGGVQLGPLGTAATDWPIVACPG
jgi:hypothetical protein